MRRLTSQAGAMTLRGRAYAPAEIMRDFTMTRVNACEHPPAAAKDLRAQSRGAGAMELLEALRQIDKEHGRFAYGEITTFNALANIVRIARAAITKATFEPAEQPSPAAAPMIAQLTEPVHCPGCGCLIFIRENRTIVAHYNQLGNRCHLNETLADDDLYIAQFAKPSARGGCGIAARLPLSRTGLTNQ